MNPIWKIHSLLKNKLPKKTIKQLRTIIESQTDFLWRKDSYSQFGEDSVLMGMLEARNWNPELQTSGLSKKKGFYVDVGACAPKQFSNTYLFYKKGWRGINIDATPGSMTIFNKVRKRDINIETAVSDTNQELTFYTWGVHELTNTFSPEHAEEFAKAFGKQPDKVILRTKRLDQILDENLPKNQQIDFISVDAENHNLEVLRSNNWEKYRPTYVIVELDDSVRNIEEIANSEMVSFMKQKGYHLCSWIDINLFFERDAS
jgi:FkbM family methyltransferase